MKVALLCGGYPPDFDAIGHYTSRLAQELRTQAVDVTVLTSSTVPREDRAGIKVRGVFDPTRPLTLKGLPDELAASGDRFDWLIVQYNPFSFGPRGFAPQLPAALAEIKRRGLCRIAIMFHETCVPRWPWKFSIMWCWQYPQFRRLCAVADLAFVSTERWTPQVRRARRSLGCHHLPVGSNIPKLSIARAAARKELSLPPEAYILGVFGQAHISRLLDWIGDFARTERKRVPGARVLYVGPDGARLREACQGVDFIDVGRQPEERIGLYLRAMDVFVSPFMDGVSTRRGSVLAAMQHGIPVTTTRREWTDKILTDHPPDSLLVSAAGDSSAFTRITQQWWQDRAFSVPDPAMGAFYERHFSWEVIAGRMLALLRSAAQS